MKKLIYFTLGLAVMLASCSDDDDDSKWVTPPSEGATMTLHGGPGEGNAIYSVYVDFSANKQDTLKRSSWNLAFNCGSDFGVFLNSTTIGRAKEATGIDIADVISEETLQPYATALAMTMGEANSSMDIVDSFDKSISGTVIKEGKTYIYRNENATLPYYKVKVTKKDNNTYSISYALWNSSEVKTADVKKDSKYNIIGFSLTDAKTVIVEKEKGEWDIIWGRNTYESSMVVGQPSAMADIVFINNKNGVKAVQILEEDIAYADYSESDITTTTLLSDIGVIGANWRSVGGGGTAKPVAYQDRYYVIRDVAGNIYKLKFMAIGGGTDGATRGYPQLKFELVKEAQ